MCEKLHHKPDFQDIWYCWVRFPRILYIEKLKSSPTFPPGYAFFFSLLFLHLLEPGLQYCEIEVFT